MILFREHRGSLKSSMKTVVEINSMEELKEKLKEAFPYLEMDDIWFEDYAYDNRIGWDTKLVMSRNKKYGSFIVGYTNGVL
jgi:hypothetical protein